MSTHGTSEQPLHVVLVPGFWLGAWAWDDVVPTSRPPASSPPGDPAGSGARRDRRGPRARHARGPCRRGHPPRRRARRPRRARRAQRRRAGRAGGPRPGPARIERVVYVDTGPLVDGAALSPDLPADVAEVPLPTWEELAEAGSSLDGLDEAALARFRERAVPTRGPSRGVVHVSDPAAWRCRRPPSARPSVRRPRRDGAPGAAPAHRAGRGRGCHVRRPPDRSLADVLSSPGPRGRDRRRRLLTPGETSCTFRKKSPKSRHRRRLLPSPRVDGRPAAAERRTTRRTMHDTLPSAPRAPRCAPPCSGRSRTTATRSSSTARRPSTACGRPPRRRRPASRAALARGGRRASVDRRLTATVGRRRPSDGGDRRTAVDGRALRAAARGRRPGQPSVVGSAASPSPGAAPARAPRGRPGPPGTRPSRAGAGGSSGSRPGRRGSGAPCPRPGRGQPGRREQLVPEPQALADRHAVVLVAVDDEHRRHDVLDEAVRAVLQRHLVRHLARPVVRVVRRRAELVESPQARVRDDRAEAVRVPRDPVRHVPAEGPAHRGSPGRVDLRARLHGVRDREQVRVRGLAPRAPAALHEVLPVTGRQRRVRQQHRVALRDHQPRVPAPAPRVPRAERAAVDPQQQRRRILRGRTVRQREPAPHAHVVRRRRLDVDERARQVGRRDRAAQRRRGHRRTAARRAGVEERPRSTRTGCAGSR